MTTRSPCVPPPDHLEHREPVVVTSYRFAVDHARPDRKGRESRSGQWKPRGEVVAITRDQAHAIGIAVTDDAEAIVLDFVQPTVTGRRCFHRTWQAGFKPRTGLGEAHPALKITLY